MIRPKEDKEDKEDTYPNTSTTREKFMQQTKLGTILYHKK